MFNFLEASLDECILNLQLKGENLIADECPRLRNQSLVRKSILFWTENFASIQFMEELFFSFWRRHSTNQCLVPRIAKKILFWDFTKTHSLSLFNFPKSDCRSTLFICESLLNNEIENSYVSSDFVPVFFDDVPDIVIPLIHFIDETFLSNSFPNSFQKKDNFFFILILECLSSPITLCL